MNKKSLLFTSAFSGVFLALLLFIYPGVNTDPAVENVREDSLAAGERGDEIAEPDSLQSPFSTLPQGVAAEAGSREGDYPEGESDHRSRPAGLNWIEYDAVLFEEVGEVDSRGRFERIRVVETDFHYPYIRIVEELESGPGGDGETLRGWQAMVADHVIARMDTSLTDAEIEGLFSDVRVQVRRRMEEQGLFLLEFPLEGADAIDGALARLAEESGAVEYAEPDYIVTPAAIEAPSDPGFGLQWGLDNQFGREDADIDALRAWEIRTDASDVVVAVIDTGIHFNHEDLKHNMWRNPHEQVDGFDNSGSGFADDIHGVNVITGGNPMDFDGHGTHVAGTVGAVGDNVIGVTGVAWDVQLMAVKFLDPFGAISDAIVSYDYARFNGADVINASFGGFYFSRAEKEAIRRLRDAGITFVTSAGNDSKNIDIFRNFFPANYDLDNIVRVGATNPDGHRAFFSNYGPESVDIMAPGESIYSTFVGGNDNAYEFLSGTSMASPHVAGMMALIAAEYPGENYQTLINRLLEGARREPLFFEGVARESRFANLFDPLAQGDAPIVFAHLQDVDFAEGQTHTLAVEAAGRPAVEYAWYRDDVLIAGEDGPELTLENMTADDAGRYRVEMTSGGVTVESHARVRFNPGIPAFGHALGAPELTWTTSDDRPWEIEGSDRVRSYPGLGNNESSRLIATVHGPATISFDWHVSSEQHYDKLRFLVNGEEEFAISGESSARVTDFHLPEARSYQLAWSYEKDLVGTAGEDAGWVENVSFEPHFPHILEQPGDIEVVEGSTARFKVRAIGDPSPRYRWYRNGERLEGESSRILDISDVEAADEGFYHAVVWNSHGSLQTVAAQLTVVSEANPPSVVSQPQDITVMEGGIAVFRVGYTGTAPIQVQWASEAEGDIAGATGDRLVLTGVTPEDAGAYYARLSNAAGEVTAGPATLTVISEEDTFEGFLLSQGVDPGTVSAEERAGLLYEYATGSSNQPSAVVRSEELRSATAAEAGDVSGVAPVRGDRHLGLEFTRSTRAVGVSYRLEASADLRTWEEVPHIEENLGPAGEGSERIVLREEAPLAGNGPRFLRLKIVHAGR